MHDTIRLEPGANTSLTDLNPFLDDLTVGFGWDVIQSNGPTTGLVAAAVILNSEGRAIENGFAFFNQLETADGAVNYIAGDDEEQLEVRLSAIPEVVQKIVFVVFCDPDSRNPGTFDPVRNAYIHLMGSDGAEFVRFDVPRTNEPITAVNFAELYRYNGKWKFRALGDGYRDGVAGISTTFGVRL